MLDASEGISEEFRRADDWHLIQTDIAQCEQHDFAEDRIRELGRCAELALEARRDVHFRDLRNAIERDRQRNRGYGPLSGHLLDATHENTSVDDLLVGIQFLGHLRSSYDYFLKFRDKESAIVFDYKIISVDQAEWNGKVYREKILT